MSVRFPAASRSLLRRCFTSRSLVRQPAPTNTPTIDEPIPFDLDDLLNSFPEDNQSSTASVPEPLSVIEDEVSGLTSSDLKRRRDRMNRAFESIGGSTSTIYTPRQSLHAPETIEKINVELLLASQAHLGHSTALWNPVMQPYIYGSRNGIHFFDLEKTLEHLKLAAKVVHGVAKNDGNILFVGTRPGQKRFVVEAAKRAQAYHVFDRWVPGTITNGKHVVGHGQVSTLVTKHKRNSPPPASPMPQPNAVLPDLIIVLNPLENRNLMKECAKGRVPTIGIIDTDADPRWVTYAIPANDDSLRCASLIAGVLSRAAAQGRKEMALPDWEQLEIKYSR